MEDCLVGKRFTSKLESKEVTNFSRLPKFSCHHLEKALAEAWDFICPVYDVACRSASTIH
jgi:hypothetical protein